VDASDGSERHKIRRPQESEVVADVGEAQFQPLRDLSDWPRTIVKCQKQLKPDGASQQVGELLYGLECVGVANHGGSFLVLRGSPSLFRQWCHQIVLPPLMRSKKCGLERGVNGWKVGEQGRPLKENCT
jgi:hypothetical protein